MGKGGLLQPTPKVFFHQKKKSWAQLLLLLLLLYNLHIGCVKGMKHATPWHTISIDNHGRYCYSELKGLHLPPRKRGSLFTKGSPLQAALHLSRSIAHEGWTPLTLRSFSRTSFQLFGGLPTLPPSSTSGNFLHLLIHASPLLLTYPYHLSRLSLIKLSMLLKPNRLFSFDFFSANHHFIILWRREHNNFFYE